MKGWGAAALLTVVACAHGPRFTPAQLQRALDLPARALAGRALVVTFVATDCFPCLEDLPNQVELQTQLGGRGLQVVWVGMDAEGPLVLMPFAAQYNLPFPLVAASDSIRAGTSLFGPIRAVPSTAIISRDGTLLAAFEGLRSREALAPVLQRALADW